MSTRMDWYSVMALLSETSGPVLVLDADLRIRFCNGSMETLLARRGADIEGRRLDEVCDSPAIGGLVDARAGVVERRTCALVTADDVHVELVVEALHLEGGAVVLVVQEARHRARLEADADREPLEYEIRPGLTGFGRLVRLHVGGVVTRYWANEAPRCHEAIHARRDPCADCPVLRCPSAPAVRAPDGPGRPYEILRVVASPECVRVRVQRVSDGAMRALRRLQLSELVDETLLGRKEIAVLEHLIDGRSIDQIAGLLDMSERTVRQHKLAVLAKLGGGSRAHLLRILL